MEELDTLVIRQGVITQKTIICAKPLPENIKKKNRIFIAINTDYEPKNNLSVGICKGDRLPFLQVTNLGGSGRMISRWIFRKWDGGMDWILLA